MFHERVRKDASREGPYRGPGTVMIGLGVKADSRRRIQSLSMWGRDGDSDDVCAN